MPRLSSYGSLCMTIASRIKNEDAIAYIPEFVEIAEADLRLILLKTRYLTERTTVNTVANNCSITLSSAVARPLSASIAGNMLGRVPSSTMQCHSSYTGTPEFYGLDGVNKIRLYPMPNAVVPVEIVYIPEIEALSATNQTNWLLEKMPSVYLYGALVAAKEYMQDANYVQVVEMYKQSVAQLIDADITTMPLIMQQINVGS